MWPGAVWQPFALCDFATDTTDAFLLNVTSIQAWCLRSLSWMGTHQPWNSLTVASEKDELETVVHGSWLLALAWILRASHLELWVFF